METTIAQKLDALLKLQQIDSSLDELKKMRGDLPEEVQDLEDEVTGFDTRIGKYQRDIDSLDEEITKYKNTKKDSEKLIGKYKDQQMNVRNNREYDAISKEIELQQLEMELADKRINESNFKIKSKQEDIDATKFNREERKKDLDNKKKELDVLLADSREEESELRADREKAAKLVDERFFNAYERIRSNSRNGLAVVMVKRGACGGCFNMVPPQRQADIREKKKIIVCEHCGRILADVEDVPVPVSSGRR